MEFARNRKRRIFVILILFLPILLGILAACDGDAKCQGINIDSCNGNNGGTPTNVSVPKGIGIVTKPNNEQVGLSDGTYAFDIGTDRADASLKTQATAALARGDKVGATSLWNRAVGKNGIDTSDAEVLIYLEDQRILASHLPYITLIVGTMLTGSSSSVGTGRDNLQGAYVAQKEYNDGRKLNGGKLIRLLIANAGSKPEYLTDVAKLIIEAKNSDSSIVGIMGWSFSAYAHKAVDVLASAHIPMVSATASADDLSGISPYFFRVAPPNKSQAIAAAKYSEQQLNAHRVALFVDPNNPYSSSLANDFKSRFVDTDKNQIVDTENYTVGEAGRSSLPAHLQSALNSNPDLIYFSGYADDLSVLLVNLPTSLPNLQVMGGDALYELEGYPSSARAGFTRLHFTAFAYPDEWSILGMGSLPPFFSDYATDFNPADADHSAKPYGFTRADNTVILAYDAMSVLLQGCQNVLQSNNTLTPDALRTGLSQITGTKAIQGISGQISFGSDGDPINKAVVILYVDQDGHIQLPRENVQGCFQLSAC